MNLKNLTLVQMDKQTQRAMIWKDVVYETIMGYLTIACDSENLPKTVKNAIMQGIEDLHLLDMHDYQKLSISVNQTFWNMSKALMRAMRTGDRVTLSDQLKESNKFFTDRIAESEAISTRIQKEIETAAAVKQKEGETDAEAKA